MLPHYISWTKISGERSNSNLPTEKFEPAFLLSQIYSPDKLNNIGYSYYCTWFYKIAFQTYMTNTVLTSIKNCNNIFTLFLSKSIQLFFTCTAFVPFLSLLLSNCSPSPSPSGWNPQHDLSNYPFFALTKCSGYPPFKWSVKRTMFLYFQPFPLVPADAANIGCSVVKKAASAMQIINLFTLPFLTTQNFYPHHEFLI